MSKAHNDQPSDTTAAADPEPEPPICKVQRMGLLPLGAMCRLSSACRALSVAPLEVLAQHALAEQSIQGYPKAINVGRALNWAARVGAASVWRWLARTYPQVGSEELNTCMVRAAGAGHDWMVDMLLAHADAACVTVPAGNVMQVADLLIKRDRALGRAFVARHDLPARFGSPVGRQLVLHANDLFADVLVLSTWVMTLFHFVRSVPERERAVQSASPRLQDRWVAHAQSSLPELERIFAQQNESDFRLAWCNLMGEDAIDHEACMRAARHLASACVLEAVRAWPGAPEAQAQALAQAKAEARRRRWP